MQEDAVCQHTFSCIERNPWALPFSSQECSHAAMTFSDTNTQPRCGRQLFLTADQCSSISTLHHFTTWDAQGWSGWPGSELNMKTTQLDPTGRLILFPPGWLWMTFTHSTQKYLISRMIQLYQSTQLNSNYCIMAVFAAPEHLIQAAHADCIIMWLQSVYRLDIWCLTFSEACATEPTKAECGEWLSFIFLINTSNMSNNAFVDISTLNFFLSDRNANTNKYSIKSYKSQVISYLSKLLTVRQQCDDFILEFKNLH